MNDDTFSAKHIILEVFSFWYLFPFYKSIILSQAIAASLFSLFISNVLHFPDKSFHFFVNDFLLCLQEEKNIRPRKAMKKIRKSRSIAVEAFPPFLPKEKYACHPPLEPTLCHTYPNRWYSLLGRFWWSATIRHCKNASFGWNVAETIRQSGWKHPKLKKILSHYHNI